MEEDSIIPADSDYVTLEQYNDLLALYAQNNANEMDNRLTVLIDKYNLYILEV